MVKYTKVNVRLSDIQLKKLKDAVSNNTGTTLRISLKMFNGNNLPHELLLTINLSKAQISEIIQSGGFFGKLKTGLPLTKIVIKPLAKSVLIPLGLTAAASAADAGIHKKKY